jgi:aerotaxis receptor
MPLALGLGAGSWWLCWRRRERALQRLLDDALALAAGDLSHRPATGADGSVGALQLALAQMAVNLRAAIVDVRAEVENIHGVVGEIAAGNQDLSSRTESQAGSIELTATSMGQIIETVRQSAASAMQGAGLAVETAAIAQRSQEGVLGVVQAMDGISESSRRIGEIIHVIEGVAFQTNILALNAAVEAARAGDAGRGFAVVATEVRMLAQRTTSAAREIKQLITEAAERVQLGAQQTQAARQRMGEALQSVGQVSAVLSEISAGAQAQQAGVGQVNEAITDLEGITQQNAAMVEQLAAASQSLGAQLKIVSDGMRVFRLRPGDTTIAETDAAALRREHKPAVACGGDAAAGALDVKAAIAAHMDWKTRLRSAAMRGEQFDLAEVSRDDCCPLGRWLHGAGQRQWSGQPVFSTLLEQHARFHRQVGEVARLVNAGQHDQAQAGMAGGTPFAKATQATVVAIQALQHAVTASQPGATGQPARAAALALD